jgi:hypothetical protein
MLRARLTAGLGLVALAPTGVLCQQRDTAANLAPILRRAQAANQIVRLRSVSGTEAVGRISALADSTVQIGRQTLRFFDQHSIEARFTHPDPLWNGAAIGAAVNLVSYPLITSFAESMSEQRLTRREKVSCALGSALFGMLVGGAIDAARERRPEWRVVWRRAEP